MSKLWHGVSHGAASGGKIQNAIWREKGLGRLHGGPGGLDKTALSFFS